MTRYACYWGENSLLYAQDIPRHLAVQICPPNCSPNRPYWLSRLNQDQPLSCHSEQYRCSVQSTSVRPEYDLRKTRCSFPSFAIATRHFTRYCLDSTQQLHRQSISLHVASTEHVLARDWSGFGIWHVGIGNPRLRLRCASKWGRKCVESMIGSTWVWDSATRDIIGILAISQLEPILCAIYVGSAAKIHIYWRLQGYRAYFEQSEKQEGCFWLSTKKLLPWASNASLVPHYAKSLGITERYTFSNEKECVCTKRWSWSSEFGADLQKLFHLASKSMHRLLVHMWIEISLQDIQNAKVPKIDRKRDVSRAREKNSVKVLVFVVIHALGLC